MFDGPPGSPVVCSMGVVVAVPAVSMIEPPPRMSPLTVSVPAISTGPSRLIFGALRLTAPVADPHLAGADPHFHGAAGQLDAVAMRSPVVTNEAPSSKRQVSLLALLSGAVPASPYRPGIKVPIDTRPTD